ncbi:hypothetical protein [Prochlorococcus sp. MIT 1201]|uniref:hypothetical protein n=1 Tax=Prochlorococcus sp. MIT 1201 TaxID=3082535 RepID=UPI0039A6DDF2
MNNPKEHKDSVNLDKCWDEEKVELTDTDLEGVDGGGVFIAHTDEDTYVPVSQSRQ